jgi:glycosyltransferase involved in cell wall biosynthesis
MLRVVALVPCYNEGESIKRTIETLKEKTPDIDFIVINDGSKDNTHSVCIENNYPVINFPFNLGLSNAIQTGMRYACNNGYEMALQFDGDGQHDPIYIPEMVQKMQDTSADIVIGSRHLKKSSHEGMRGLGQSLIKFAIRITTGKKLTDPTSGMRLYNRRMIEKFAHQMNFGPEPDTLVYLMNNGVNVVETSVTMRERKAGKSYLTSLNAVNYMLRMLVSIIIVQWFRTREK